MYNVTALNLKTGQKTERYTALQHRHALERDPQAGNNLIFFSSYDGDPMEFVKGTQLSSHFSRVAGYGRTNMDRVTYDNDKKRFRPGTKTVLMLSEVFGYKNRALDFANLEQPKKVWPLSRLIAANNGKVDFRPVATINEAVEEMQRVKRLGKSLSHNLFASFGGGVVRYDEFFFDWNTKHHKAKNAFERYQIFHGHELKLANLFNRLKGRVDACVTYNDDDGNPNAQNRAVGMPVLLRVSANARTRSEEGAKGLKCNRYFDTPQSELMVIARPLNTGEGETIAFQEMRKNMATQKQADSEDYYVLASPVVGVDPADATQLPRVHKINHHVINMTLNDTAAQVRPVGRLRVITETENARTPPLTVPPPRL